MEYFLKIFNFLLNIIDKVGPTLAAIIAVYAAYKFGIKRILFEDKKEFHKQIRATVSNLMLIWKEVSSLQEFFKKNDPNIELILKYPGLAKLYLQIDKSKIKKLEKSYYESLAILKTIDIELYLKLEISYSNFKLSLNDFLMPIIEDKSISNLQKVDVILPLLADTINELKTIIKSSISYLEKKEKEKILSVVSKQFESNNVIVNNDIEDIPDMVIDFFNNSLTFLHEPITKEELITFWNNTTIQWLIKKVLETDILGIFIQNPADILKIFILVNHREKFEDKIKQIEDKKLLLQITITEEENKKFINNKPLYFIFMIIFKKIEGNIPFELKRHLVRLNRGEINIKKEIDKMKEKILLSLEIEKPVNEASKEI